MIVWIKTIGIIFCISVCVLLAYKGILTSIQIERLGKKCLSSEVSDSKEIWGVKTYAFFEV